MQINKWLAVMVLATLFLPCSFRPVLAQDEVSWLLEQINALRASQGLPPYVLNGILSTAAQMHSQWMADTGTVSHEETSGSTPKSRAATLGYTGSLVSENIYGGTIAKASDAWNFWINSSIHYRGLTHDLYNEVGIGIASGPYGNFYTLVFGNGGSGSLSRPTVPNQPQVNPVEVVQEQAVVPTQVWITWTPSPTFPTDTPTVTWTPTLTWTPSATPSLAPATSTPLPLSILVASIPSLTPSATPTEFIVALAPMHTTPALDIQPISVKAASSGGQTSFDWRIVLPVLIIVQVVMLGFVIQFMLNRREAG